MSNWQWLHTPSTNVGIAAILTAGASFFSGATDLKTTILGVVMGVVAILLPEKAA